MAEANLSENAKQGVRVLLMHLRETGRDSIPIKEFHQRVGDLGADALASSDELGRLGLATDAITFGFREISSVNFFSYDCETIQSIGLTEGVKSESEIALTRPITMSEAAKFLGSDASNSSQYCRRREAKDTLKIQVVTDDMFRFNLDAFPAEHHDRLN
ncbi:MAG: hypothetical protein ABGX16_04675 [Pirellulales bacterium]